MSGLRGVALVDEVIARVRRGDGPIDIALPDPLPARVLQGLALPGGAPLPPSLSRWLAFDAAWLETWCHAWSGPAEPSFQFSTIPEVARDLMDYPGGWSAFRSLPKYADIPILPLDHGGEWARCLLLAAPDEHGEYPVINVCKDPHTYIELTDLGFDTWLARRAGLIRDAANTVYSQSFRAMRHRVLGERTPQETEPFGQDALAAEGPADKEAEREAALTATAIRKRRRVAAPAMTRSHVLPTGVSAEHAGKIIVQAMAGSDPGKVWSLLDQAAQRFASSRAWATQALTAWQPEHGKKVLELLLDAGADPNLPALNPKVHQVAACGDAAALARLLDADGRGDLTDHQEQTPLHRAADRHQLDSVRLLLERGAAVDAQDPRHNTSLAEALHAPWDDDPHPDRRDRMRDTVTLLLAHGASPNPADPVNHPPLHHAVDLDTDLLGLLIHHGADLSVRNWRGDTALHHAWREQRWTAYDLLRAADAPLDAVNHAGWSLQQAASADGRTPRRLALDLSDTPEPVDYQIDVEVVFTDHVHPDHVTRVLRLLEALASTGVAGLDRYPPGSSTARWNGDDFQHIHPDPAAPGRIREHRRLRAVYRTENLPNQAFGLWITALTHTPDMRLASLEVAPTAPLRTTRWDPTQWISGLPATALRAPSPLPFPVHDTKAPNRLCTITAHPEQHAAITALVADLCDLAATVVPIAPHRWTPQHRLLLRPAMRHNEHLMFRYIPYDAHPVPPGHIHLLRTLTLTALAALDHNQAGLHAVDWNLGNQQAPSAFTDTDFHPTEPSDSGPIPDDVPF